MTTEVLLTICTAVSGLILIGLTVFAVVVLRRLPKAPSVEQSYGISKIGSRQEGLIQVSGTHAPYRPQIDSVIARLSFAESFDPERFAMASQESALSLLNNTLKATAGDGLLISISSINLLTSGAELTFSASKAGQTMLSNGTAVLGRHGSSGKVLPYLKDASTGKILEQLKGVSSVKVLTNLAAASAIVVGAAHMIAGADIAKRLKQVDAKINLLLAYRLIDQSAILERIYTSAKELLRGPISSDKCWELWRLRGEVRELRYKWRSELQHRLNLVEDRKNSDWLQWMFGSDSAMDGNIHRSITEGEVQLGLIEYSMRLDQALAIASGTVGEFERTLSDELHSLEELATLLRDKAASIRGKDPKLAVEPTVNAMTAVVEQYRSLLPTAI